MVNLTFSLGQLKITPLFWCLCLALFISSFSAWRRLIKEDYSEEEIFSTSLFMILAGVTFGRLALIAAKTPLAGAFWGVVLVAVWRFRSLGKNVWEGLDSLALPWLYFLIFTGAGFVLDSGKYLYLGYTLIGLLGVASYPYLKKSYRRFSWYRSGKVGFIFWAIAGGTFLPLLVLDFFINPGLYWSRLFWLVSVLISAGAIYYRGELNK